jgi:hypothetical protein
LYTNVRDGESTFNYPFIYPFLDVLAMTLTECVIGRKADFKYGEASSLSMYKQLKNLELYKDNIYSYLTDGIMKLYGLKDFEVLLLVASSHFGCTDKSKIRLDNSRATSEPLKY